MTIDIIKLPGPGHPIEIAGNPQRIVVRLGDNVLVETRAALTMFEANYAPVHYVPLADIDCRFLTKSAHTTYCSYKGHCTYFSIVSGSARAENAVWTYEVPYPAVAQIDGHAAFCSNFVTIAVG